MSSTGVLACLPMLTPMGNGGRWSDFNRAATASAPSLLKPMRFRIARRSGSRCIRGLGLPACGLRRDRAEFDEAEAERPPGRHRDRVLIEPAGEADAIGKF